MWSAMSDSFTLPSENELLARLSDTAIRSLDFEYIKVKFGEELLPTHDAIQDLYFPVSAMISVVGIMSEGQTAEIGIVGQEGAVGLVALMGTDTSPYSKVMQLGGDVIRVPVRTAKKVFDNDPKFREDVLSFVQKFTTQVAQTTLCNGWHNIDQRLIRWLLMHHDRVKGDMIHLTHEFIAQMLGANRSTITQSAQKLQEAGFIKYAWGKMTILDRPALEASCCECYGIIRRAYDQPHIT
jgi:CRP-like cAMP-binding protein